MFTNCWEEKQNPHAFSLLEWHLLKYENVDLQDILVCNTEFSLQKANLTMEVKKVPSYYKKQSF